VTLDLLDLLARLAAATALSGAVGIERELRGQTAGLRTHAIVGLGAALFTVVGAYGFEEAPRGDPTRVAAQIVSGIGFLGAGAILRHGLSVRGVTTAATLWLVAAIGMACGAGAWEAAVASVALVLVSLVAVRRVRPALRGRLGSEVVTFTLDLRPPRLEEAVRALEAHGARVRALQTEVRGDEQQAELEVRLPAGVGAPALVRELAALGPVRRAAVAGVRPGRRGWDGGEEPD
jgi:putative Mg2+ transporter-C (MgtC) family protein